MQPLILIAATVCVCFGEVLSGFVQTIPRWVKGLLGALALLAVCAAAGELFEAANGVT